MPDNFTNLIKLGMGNAKSKRKGLLGRSNNKAGSPLATGGPKDPLGGNDSTIDHDFIVDMCARLAEDTELKTMRSTIDKDPEMFVLNNLMMCVQFFENYDEEMSSVRKALVSSREADMNSRLPSQTHALIPDVLQEHVARRVDFTYMLPSLKHTVELLQPIRIYVVFDNIEVTEENYASPYCSVNEAITYSMQLKPSPNHKGYVHLQHLEVNPPKKTASTNELRVPPISNGPKDEVYSDGDSVYAEKFPTNSEPAIIDAMKKSRKTDESRFAVGPRVEIGQETPSDRVKNDDTAAVSTRKENEPRQPRSAKTGKQYGKPKLPNSESPESPAGSTSSGYRSGNYMDIDTDDYSYAQTSYSGATPDASKNSLDEVVRCVPSMELPRQCFKRMEYRADGKIYDARRERRQKMSVKEQLIWQAYQARNYDVWYLNSTRFMKYFCQVFTEQLAIPMGFDPDITESTQGCVIYRDKVEILEGTMSTKVETFEIVPCVSSQWPECAQEWVDRPRNCWPRYDVIEKIKEFGCHMIPDCSVNDKGSNKFQDLEWKLIFPAAERFLETCLTYPQVRVYLIGLMLHKTFIRPVDSIFGLTTAHIKNRLFWLIEEDDRASKWAENRTGEALMRLLKLLYRSISQDEPDLPDFFIKEKNLFQEKAYLLRTQKQLKRIIENPVMYVFHAMENIRHSSKFFPRLDYEQLLRILMDDCLILVNPALAPRNLKNLSGNGNTDKDYDHGRGFWEEVKSKTSDKPKAPPKKSQIGKSLINPRKACDQVVEIPMRCARMEPRRLSALFDFFIKHFITMAEYCHSYGAMPQKTAYVEQAERLAVLLSEHPSHRLVVALYAEKLYSLKRRPPNTRLRNEPPKTPKRNPDMPVFARPLKDRYRSNEIREEPEPDSRPDDDLPVLRGNHSTTKVIVHGRDREESDDQAISNPSDVATPRKKESNGTTEKLKRVISLGEKTGASCLTETTYI